MNLLLKNFPAVEKENKLNNVCIAKLDIDGYGSETTVIYNDETGNYAFYVERQSMKISSYGGKRKITCLLVLALASQFAVSCSAKGSKGMTQAAEQAKAAAETEPVAEESPVIEVTESDREKEGTDESRVAEEMEIEFARRDLEKSVTRDVRFVNHAPYEMDTIWTSSDESVITSEGKVTRQKEDKTVTITADVGYNGKKYRKTFTLTVKRILDIDVNSLEDYSLEQLDEMNSGNKERYEVEMNDMGYIVRMLGTYSDVKVDSWETALASLYNIRSLLGIRDVFEELQPDGVTEDFSSWDYFFRQYYKGVEVRGCWVSVGQFTDRDGRASYVNSNYFPVPGDMDVLPQITFGEASKKIEQDGYVRDMTCVHDEEEPEEEKLYIYNDHGTGRLVWSLIRDKKNDTEQYEVLVDAKTGRVVDAVQCSFTN